MTGKLVDAAVRIAGLDGFGTNHVRELTGEVAAADRLTRGGILLLQSVLLKGVNDDVDTLTCCSAG